jgi:hypothetical protein
MKAPSRAWRGASVHQKPPSGGEVAKPVQRHDDERRERGGDRRTNDRAAP